MFAQANNTEAFKALILSPRKPVLHIFPAQNASNSASVSMSVRHHFIKSKDYLYTTLTVQLMQIVQRSLLVAELV